MHKTCSNSVLPDNLSRPIIFRPTRVRRRTFYDVTSLHSMSAYCLTLLLLSGRIRARGWFRLLPENVRFWFLGAVLLVLFLLMGISIIALLIVDFIPKPRWIARVEADWM